MNKKHWVTVGLNQGQDGPLAMCCIPKTIVLKAVVMICGLRGN